MIIKEENNVGIKVCTKWVYGAVVLLSVLLAAIYPLLSFFYTEFRSTDGLQFYFWAMVCLLSLLFVGYVLLVFIDIYFKSKERILRLELRKFELEQQKKKEWAEFESHLRLMNNREQRIQHLYNRRAECQNGRLEVMKKRLNAILEFKGSTNCDWDVNPAYVSLLEEYATLIQECNDELKSLEENRD